MLRTEGDAQVWEWHTEFPDMLLSIYLMVFPCARQCQFLAEMRRGSRRTDTPLGSLLFLKTFGGAGSCGILQECASPRQGMIHTSALPRLSCLLTSGHGGWSQTTWEKPHQNGCCQITQRRTQKQVFLELVPGQGEIQMGRFKSEWFTFPGFRGFNLQL